MKNKCNMLDCRQIMPEDAGFFLIVESMENGEKFEWQICHECLAKLEEQMTNAVMIKEEKN